MTDTKEQIEEIEFDKLSVREKYKKYVQTRGWKVLSKSIKDFYGCCKFCKSEENLNVHHLSYENVDFKDIGCEYLSDIVVLCKKCHLSIHNSNNSIITMIVKTKEERDRFLEIYENATFGYGCIPPEIYIIYECDVRLKDIDFK